MLEREGFVGGASIPFFWEVLWSLLIEEQEFLIKLLISKGHVDPVTGKYIDPVPHLNC